MKLTRFGSMFSIFFTEKEVVDYDAVSTCDTEKNMLSFIGKSKTGIFPARSMFYLFPSFHDLDDVRKNRECH